MTERRHSDIPLPKNWPRRLRSAVIHTISLAWYFRVRTGSSVDRNISTSSRGLISHGETGLDAKPAYQREGAI